MACRFSVITPVGPGRDLQAFGYDRAFQCADLFQWSKSVVNNTVICLAANALGTAVKYYQLDEKDPICISMLLHFGWQQVELLIDYNSFCK